MIYGVDVSSYQPEQFPLSLPGTGEPVDFAIIKVTQGVHYVNPKWQAQADWARANGLSVGFYHFADDTDYEDQVEAFLAVVRLRPGDHLWFDWESTHVTNQEKDAWIKTVQQYRPEHKVGLYCNRDFWLNRDESSFAGDALWIADWTEPGTPPRIQAPWRIHQYASTASLDRNVADFPDRAAMKAWAGEPVPSDLSDVLATLDVLVAAIGSLKDKVDAQGVELAALKQAVGKVQSTAISLPKKVADEINKRLAE